MFKVTSKGAIGGPERGPGELAIPQTTVPGASLFQRKEIGILDTTVYLDT